VGNVDGLAGILSCGVSSLPLKYLGLLLGASYKAKSTWDGVVEKIEHRLANWKMMYLSKDGRVTLIMSTLSNLPTYFLSLLHSCWCGKSHKKLYRDFLWGGIGEKFKYHMISWSKIYFSIFEGGLEVQNLKMFNRALLGKWLWRYVHERDAWWRAVDSIDISDFWPISLISEVYKIIAKVLTNRMSSIMEKIILSLKTLLLKVGRSWIQSL
jgi:hypothetical protein